ncbi:unnamed protein product [Meganyctiphanes norvegica]|uniref:Methyltransferase FkbM domain-containing protein n=1 Tax=Meganyctiphanes norvegica TaxID=48144 RepID=A0AAV2PVB6_MEGNR
MIASCRRIVRWAPFSLLFVIIFVQNSKIIIDNGSLTETQPMIDSTMVNTIKKLYLQNPDTRSYNLSSEPKAFTLDEQRIGAVTRGYIQLIFSKIMGGFYIEAGALDGEYLSNTLYLEYFQNWTGILIEPNPGSYSNLVDKHRKAWLSNTCLSTTSKPKNISMVSISSPKIFNNQYSTDQKLLLNGQTYEEKYNKYDTLLSHIDKSSFTRRTVTAACFPLEAYLIALNVTTVDLLSLDIQGGEFEVLKTIPWEMYHFRLIVVEDMNEDVNMELIRFMKSKGFNLIDILVEDYIFYNMSDVEMKSLVNMININKFQGVVSFSFNYKSIPKS